MIKNYLKVALRNLLKTKLFTAINILGLAIGMTACLLILHYVNYEKSYDTFHEDSGRIYRLRYERTSAEGKTVQFASCSPPTATFIDQRYPEVEKIARIFKIPGVVSFGDRKFTEERLYYAEPGFLEILQFPFIHGDPVNGIRDANNAFISKSTAIKYFGTQNPMGKTFRLDNREEFQVAGVFHDIPSNSHIKFDILLSFKNIYSLFGKDVLESWGHTGFFTYIKLKPGVNALDFEKRLVDLVESEAGQLQRAYKVLIHLKMQPIEDIHLTSHFMQEYEINGDKDSVNFLFIIAFFIILIAWVNYVNLSTARALTRAKEVGLRKVVGASRQQLMFQFFCEIILINFAAILIAFLLLKLSLPFFTHITGTPMSYSIWSAGWFWLTSMAMFFTGVFLSGLYPVLVMSSFTPDTALKSRTVFKGGKTGLRKALLIFQLVMTLLLIIGTLTVQYQISFMKKESLGFDMEQILVLKAPRVRDSVFQEKLTTFKEELLRLADVKNLCVATEVPGRQILWDNGGIHRAGESAHKGKNYQIVGVDFDFIPVFKLSMAAGRNFSKKFPADQDALILNETAVKWMGFSDSQSALGKQVDYWGKIYNIIGVVKDYHQQSLKAAFEPHILRLMPHGRGKRGMFAIKVNPLHIKNTLGQIQKYYDMFFPGNPFEYFFLDEYYNQQYKEDERFGKVFGIFSFLAIFVTALGILGLSSFLTLQRTKEMGIRKVLGAEIWQILYLLVKDFIILLLVSFLIVLPLSLLGISQWLNEFAKQMDLEVSLFALPLMIVSLVMLITISMHVIRTAFINPVDTLRHE